MSGLAVAYRAYLLSLDGRPAPVIDGLTGQQRFFVGFTHVWRAKTRPEETDPPDHDRPAFAARVTGCSGTLVNTDAFFEAFDVKPGDGMWRDPSDRVRIW